jgi:hypothetical protein
MCGVRGRGTERGTRYPLRDPFIDYRMMAASRHGGEGPSPIQKPVRL